MFLASLAERRLQPEIMDQPNLELNQHLHALAGLARINRISFSDRILWRPLAALARAQPGRPLCVLDVATGAGDLPIRLWQRAQRAGLAMNFTGVDASNVAVERAQRAADLARARIQFSLLDALCEPLPSGFDVITTSLFLHHLTETDAVTLLHKMGQAAGQMVLVNDLVRSRFGYVVAWFGTRVLTRSPVVHVDGPRSVEAAFTIREARTLAERAGLADAGVSWRWPWRYLLSWQPSSSLI
jgi:SAM-dependent methyltransferase